eukprot:g1289.t1
MDEEASEEEVEMEEGVGEYSYEDKLKRLKEDALDSRMDRTSITDVKAADLAGIVDAVSDDEGDSDADEAGFHLQKEMEKDQQNLDAVVKNIQQGWVKQRAGRRRGRDLELITAANKRRRIRLGLGEDSGDDAEELDDEEAQAELYERDLARHNYSDEEFSDEEQDGDAAANEGKNGDGEVDDPEEAADIAEEQLLARRARRTRAMLRARVKGKKKEGRKTSLLHDDDGSRQVRQRLHRTRTVKDDASSSAYGGDLVSEITKSTLESVVGPAASAAGSNTQSVVASLFSRVTGQQNRPASAPPLAVTGAGTGTAGPGGHAGGKANNENSISQPFGIARQYSRGSFLPMSRSGCSDMSRSKDGFSQASRQGNVSQRQFIFRQGSRPDAADENSSKVNNAGRGSAPGSSSRWQSILPKKNAAQKKKRSMNSGSALMSVVGKKNRFAPAAKRAKAGL